MAKKISAQVQLLDPAQSAHDREAAVLSKLVEMAVESYKSGQLRKIRPDSAGIRVKLKARKTKSAG